MMEHFNIDAANPVVCLTQAKPSHNLMKHDVVMTWQRRQGRIEGLVQEVMSTALPLYELCVAG